MKVEPVVFSFLSSLASARYVELEPEPHATTLSHVPMILSHPSQASPNMELRAPGQALPTAFATEPAEQEPSQPLATAGDAAETTSVGDQSSDEDGGEGGVPPYTAIVTAAPDQSAVLASEGYQQYTYYTCQTIHAESHCGYHIPLYKSEGSSSGIRAGGPVAGLWKQTKSWLGDGRKMDVGTVLVAVMGLTGIFVAGLM